MVQNQSSREPNNSDPRRLCDNCKGAGCKQCNSFGYVLSDEAASEVAEFWKTVPTVKIDTVDAAMAALGSVPDSSDSPTSRPPSGGLGPDGRRPVMARHHYETFIASDDLALADTVESLLKSRYAANKDVEVVRSLNGVGKVLIHARSTAEYDTGFSWAIGPIYEGMDKGLVPSPAVCGGSGVSESVRRCEYLARCRGDVVTAADIRREFPDVFREVGI